MLRHPPVHLTGENGGPKKRPKKSGNSNQFPLQTHPCQPRLSPAFRLHQSPPTAARPGPGPGPPNLTINLAGATILKQKHPIYSRHRRERAGTNCASTPLHCTYVLSTPLPTPRTALTAAIYSTFEILIIIGLGLRGNNFFWGFWPFSASWEGRECPSL